MRKAGLKTNSGDLGNNAQKGRIASCIGRDLMEDNLSSDVAVELLKAIGLNTQ
jgi:hypothetical protein